MLSDELEQRRQEKEKLASTDAFQDLDSNDDNL